MESQADTLLRVFVLTKTGRTLNDDGLRLAKALATGDPEISGLSPEDCGKIKDGLPPGMADVVIFSGCEPGENGALTGILDPGTLADMLEDAPDSRVIMSYNDRLMMCPYGPGENGIDLIIRNLRMAADMSMSSWECIDRSAYGKREDG